MAHDIARIEGRLVMDSKQDVVDALQKCREALIQIRGFVSVMEANNWRDRATAYRAPVRHTQFGLMKGRPMTNAEADKRARAAMSRAYQEHPDIGALASFELLELMYDAVRVEFGQMTKEDFRHRHSEPAKQPDDE